MSKFVDKRKTNIIKLPSYPEDEVTIYESLTTEQYVDVYGNNTENDLLKTMKMIKLLIKSWTFVGEDDKPWPITEENLKKFSTEDFAYLIEETTRIASLLEEKKTKN